MTLYNQPSDMEPLLPDDPAGLLRGLALDLIRASAHLSAALHPITRSRVVELVRGMNSYYSNLIEGHHTRPCDIEAALRKDFATDPKQRSLQMLHASHMETQKLLEARLESIAAKDICSPNFLRWIHKEFYERVPDEFLMVEGRRIDPGLARRASVSVGRHLPPSHEKLDLFLQRFSDFYGELVAPTPDGLIAAAAAHHRLAWIHPFLDGNGRVTRLFSHAWFVRSGVASGGLWTLSRGLARHKTEYQSALANADERRLNDFDGRGYLSSRRLGEFCEFFLRSAIDQVAFMDGLLALDGMQTRILAYGRRQEEIGVLPSGSSLVLREVFLRGEIPRGDVGRIARVSSRTGQKITGTLLSLHLLDSSTPKAPLRLSFPSDAAAYYFPNLYPAGVE